MAKRPTLTTASGAPVADNQNSITAGPRGPVLMQDFHLLEKLAHQNRERIPERTVHAKGAGAYGTLTVTNDITKYTRAAALSKVGKKTEAFLRFSTVAGERGAADAERDVRGFALRFYTEEPLAKFIERGEFSLCSRGRSGRRSGRRGPELRDAEYLIDRECHHAEHEVAFDLDRAAHAHGPCAEFILQSGVDAFGQGAKIKNDVVRIGHMDEFHALDFFGPFGLGFVLGAKVAIDDRRMAERLAVVMDGGGVVGRIHEIVEIGDAGAGHGHQGNGDLTVVDGSRGQDAGDRDLAAGDIQMQFVADPGFLVALAVLLGADIARGGQIGEHLIEVLRGLPFEARRLGFWPFLVLARASALARRLSAIGRRRILLFVVRLRLDRLLARLDLGGVARDHADDAPAERALDQRRVHLVGQIALGKLREGAGK